MWFVLGCEAPEVLQVSWDCAGTASGGLPSRWVPGALVPFSQWTARLLCGPSGLSADIDWEEGGHHRCRQHG